jgi:archaellum biogenesis ATPase FlaH
MKLSTGIDALDRRLSGGVPAGNILAVVAPPASQSESVIFQIMQQRPTLFISTLREPDAIEAGIAGMTDRAVEIVYAGQSPSMDNEFTKKITGTRVHSFSKNGQTDALERVYEAIDTVDEQINVVIDPTNPLERIGEAGAYREVLNSLKSVLLETDSLGVIHCIDQEEPMALRETSLLVADMVWELELVALQNRVEYQLTVPKNRGRTPLLEEISLVFDPEVWIDDSRNI